MADLIDPSKEPYEIIRWDEEKRRHIRNDGKELKDAENNIFYHLMTVGKTHDERRRYWNGWACQNLSDEARATLAKDLEIDPHDLRPLKKSEIAEIEKRLESKLPKIPITLDFSNTYFPYGISAITFYFPCIANFEGAQFEGFTTFQSAHFASGAEFEGAQFADWAIFQTAQFASWQISKMRNLQTGHFSTKPNSNPSQIFKTPNSLNSPPNFMARNSTPK